MKSFTAIDFELANADYTSVCAVGIICVENGKIVDEFYSLVKPPGNRYMWQATRVHGIKAKHTKQSPTFDQVFEKIRPLIQNRKIVAHNELFDRSVMQKTMEYYGLDYSALSLPKKWVCTSEIYRKQGFERTKLNLCCDIMGIELNHHDALSDARACALLYLEREHAAAKKLIAQESSTK